VQHEGRDARLVFVEVRLAAHAIAGCPHATGHYKGRIRRNPTGRCAPRMSSTWAPPSAPHFITIYLFIY
jgi:hypothetical protein